MTPEVRVAALCDHALVGQDGKVTMVGIFRNISVSRLPAQHPRMYLVAVLGLEPGPHEVVVRLVRPDGSAAMPEAPRIQVRASPGQDVNVIVELNNLNFAVYGAHHFDVEVDGAKVESLPVAIGQMPATPGRAN
ncbi:MAG: hypothetical protein KGJ98_00820 [Chloroflexota bacterium]|nr:hypothetical protein [Chloroflexota bacterium]MDE3100757.1 hypothetical protein [Chloroflexota bacterium]